MGANGSPYDIPNIPEGQREREREGLHGRRRVVPSSVDESELGGCLSSWRLSDRGVGKCVMHQRNDNIVLESRL